MWQLIKGGLSGSLPPRHCPETVIRGRGDGVGVGLGVGSKCNSSGDDGDFRCRRPRPRLLLLFPSCCQILADFPPPSHYALPERCPRKDLSAASKSLFGGKLNILLHQNWIKKHQKLVKNYTNIWIIKDFMVWKFIFKLLFFSDQTLLLLPLLAVGDRLLNCMTTLEVASVASRGSCPASSPFSLPANCSLLDR